MSNNQTNTHEELNDQLLVRREKMSDMAQAEDVNPFDAGFERTHLSTELIEAYDEYDKEYFENHEKIQVSVAGRMISKRGKGKAGFSHIQDMAGKIQIYVR